VILVDGSLDASGVADLVERHFARFLQPGQHRTASQAASDLRREVSKTRQRRPWPRPRRSRPEPHRKSFVRYSTDGQKDQRAGRAARPRIGLSG
jgi:hypothetical protein